MMTHYARLVPMMLAITLATACLSGCGSMAHIGESSEIEAVELTQDEKDFLKRMYINQTRIDQGDLTYWHGKTIELYRFTKEYLEKKYPGCQFDILVCKSDSDEGPYEYTFSEQGSEDTYTLYLYKNEDEPGYNAKDNFYMVVQETLEEKASEYMLETLKQVSDDIIKVKFKIPYEQWGECEENITIDDVISGKLDVNIKMTIYVMSNDMTLDEMGSMSRDIENKVSETEIYGSNTVEFINDLEKLESDTLTYKDYTYEYTFQHFREQVM